MTTAIRNHWPRALGVLWFALVLLWPKASNRWSPIPDAKQSKMGEGLYKSAITNANFGLLGVQFYESSEGKKRWHIHSKFAELHRKDHYAYLKEVLADFYAEKTGNVVTTRADYGRTWTERNYVELEGNVSIQSTRGYQFNMEHLNYNGPTHEFTTEDVVTMRGPDVKRPTMFLKGTGLLANIDQEHFLLNRNVSSQKKMKNGNWIKITSKSGEFFTDESRAVFIGSVRTVMPNAHITSDIFQMSSAKNQENLEARGSVMLKNKDRIGYAETAHLEVGGNEIILEGKAKIISKDNVIEGKRIKLYTDDDRVEIEEAEGRPSNDSSR